MDDTINQDYKTIAKWVNQEKTQSFCEYSVIVQNGFYYLCHQAWKNIDHTETISGYMEIIELNGITIEEWIADVKARIN